MYQFHAAEMKDRCVQWIRDWFEKNGAGCNAVVGISGGKDSSVVAALCVEALGKDRVIGVLMPCGVQGDIDMARKLVDVLGIKNYEVNIKAALDGILGRVFYPLRRQRGRFQPVVKSDGGRGEGHRKRTGSAGGFGGKGTD